MRVRFVKYDGPFQVGEEKDCYEGEAEKLIRHGVAVDAQEPVPDGLEETLPVDGFRAYRHKRGKKG